MPRTRSGSPPRRSSPLASRRAPRSRPRGRGALVPRPAGSQLTAARPRPCPRPVRVLDCPLGRTAGPVASPWPVARRAAGVAVPGSCHHRRVAESIRRDGDRLVVTLHAAEVEVLRDLGRPARVAARGRGARARAVTRPATGCSPGRTWTRPRTRRRREWQSRGPRRPGPREERRRSRRWSSRSTRRRRRRGEHGRGDARRRDTSSSGSRR